MLMSNVFDKNKIEIKSGDILKDDWNGFLYKVQYQKGAFALISTGQRIVDGEKRDCLSLGSDHKSLIYDNYEGFSKRHGIVS